jgi:hypothetical protein
MMNVMNDGSDDDYNDYSIKLRNAIGKNYYTLQNQDNSVEMLQAPQLGENKVEVAADDNMFKTSVKSFIALPG